MIKNSLVLCFTSRTLYPQLFAASFSRGKLGLSKLRVSTPFYQYSDELKLSLSNLGAGLTFGITQAKNLESIIHEAPVQNHLKRVQKTAEIIHCFDPKTHK